MRERMFSVWFVPQQCGGMERKMYKKRVAVVLVIIILVVVALGFPVVIHYYSDKRLVNKIQYVKSNDIDILSSNENMDVASKLQILDEQVLTDTNTMSVSVEVDPMTGKFEEICDKAEAEIMKWLEADVMNLEQAGVSVSRFADFVIQDVQLYNVGQISVFQVYATLMGQEDTSLRILLDSDCYKIYSLYICGGAVEDVMQGYENYNLKKGVDISSDNSYVVSGISDYELEEIASQIGQYYEIDTPELINKSENNIEYILLDNLIWNINFFDDKKIPTLNIGISNI